MHMTIDKTRGQPAPFQIAFLTPAIFTMRAADANNQAASYGNIGRVTLATTDVDKFCVAQHKLSRQYATRNLNAALKFIHKKNPPYPKSYPGTWPHKSRSGRFPSISVRGY